MNTGKLWIVTEPARRFFGKQKDAPPINILIIIKSNPSLNLLFAQYSEPA